MEKFKTNKKIEFLIFLTLFLSSITLFKYPFEGYIHYLIFLGLLPFYFSRFGYPKYILQILIFTLFVGIYNVYFGYNKPFFFIKVWGGLFLSLTFYYFSIRYFSFNAKRLFFIYLKWAYVIAVIGIVQAITYVIGLKIGYDYSWLLNKWRVVNGGLIGIRINSILSEPSQLAMVLAPAAYFALKRVFNRKSKYNLTQSIVILVATILTTSSSGYIGLLVSLMLILNIFSFRNIFLGIIIVGTIGTVLYRNVGEFQSRVDSSVGLWYYQDFALENTNTSSYVLYSNFIIAVENIYEHPIFGTGLGSHESAHDRYAKKTSKITYDFEFNKQDGNSTFVRLMSETGFLGIILLFVFLSKNYISFKKEKIEFQSDISKALLVIIILYLLRQGNYFLNGFPFFVLLYYYNRVQKEYSIAVDSLDTK